MATLSEQLGHCSWTLAEFNRHHFPASAPSDLHSLVLLDPDHQLDILLRPSLHTDMFQLEVVASMSTPEWTRRWRQGIDRASLGSVVEGWSIDFCFGSFNDFADRFLGGAWHDELGISVNPTSVDDSVTLRSS
jgi:hypothetical protein